MFKNILAEFAGEQKRISFRAKGLFSQEKRLAFGSSVVDCGFPDALAGREWGRKGSSRMTYVVTESCIKCKYTDCVDVCPVDCFREGPNMLVIDPEECIDCTLCVPECPVEAIFAEDDVPPEQREWAAVNADLSRIWKPIVERKPAPPDADEWAKVKDKKHLLER